MNSVRAIARTFLLFSIGSCVFSLHAQADSILAFPAQERQLVLFAWVKQLTKSNPSESLLKMDRMADDFAIAHEPRLEEMARSLMLYYNLKFAGITKEEKLVLVDRTADQARKEDWDVLETETDFWKGDVLLDNREFGAGIELMLKAVDQLEKTGWSNPFTASLGYESLGHTYYRFGDMLEAIRYLMKARQSGILKTHPGYSYTGLNTIGLSYQQLMQYDSALHYYALAREGAVIHRDSFWTALITGNIGSLYYQTGQFDSAYHHLQTDYLGSIQSGILGSAVNAGSLLANIELKRGNMKQAEAYIRFSRTHMDTANLSGMIGYLENMYAYSKLKKDFQKAVAYSDTLQSYKARKEKVLGKNILEQARMRAQVARHATEVQALEFARHRQILVRNALMAILALLGIIGLLLIGYVRHKRKSMSERLERAHGELTRYAATLLEKNELIQSFREELKRAKTGSGTADEERSATIGTLTHTTILTDEDWRQFKVLFDTVYPGYLTRLRERFTDLTPAEARLMALTKLRLPSKEMAEILGISQESIRKTRYRLRKKINLPEEGTLEELADLI